MFSVCFLLLLLLMRCTRHLEQMASPEAIAAAAAPAPPGESGGWTARAETPHVDALDVAVCG